MTPLTAAQVLDAYFLDARARILELAATLDRVGRGAGADAAAADPRAVKLREAVRALLAQPAGRAEAVQRIFSLDYDPGWVWPEPR